MGWGHCGTDSKGREIGYCIDATCDHPGCDEKINRGLAYACGGMHGNDEHSCERYFCHKHRNNYTDCESPVCPDCYKIYRDNWVLEFTALLEAKNLDDKTIAVSLEMVDYYIGEGWEPVRALKED